MPQQLASGDDITQLALLFLNLLQLLVGACKNLLLLSVCPSCHALFEEEKSEAESEEAGGEAEIVAGEKAGNVTLPS